MMEPIPFPLFLLVLATMYCFMWAYIAERTSPIHAEYKKLQDDYDDLISELEELRKPPAYDGHEK